LVAVGVTATTASRPPCSTSPYTGPASIVCALPVWPTTPMTVGSSRKRAAICTCASPESGGSRSPNGRVPAGRVLLSDSIASSTPRRYEVPVALRVTAAAM
jgi:hypothetical protein